MREELLKIINHYGVIPQLKYFQSEVFELTEAIIDCKHFEDMFEIDKSIPEHNKDYFIKHITEEIADVLVILNQFVEYYKIQESDIYMIMEKKIDRQLERMED